MVQHMQKHRLFFPMIFRMIFRIYRTQTTPTTPPTLATPTCPLTPITPIISTCPNTSRTPNTLTTLNTPGAPSSVCADFSEKSEYYGYELLPRLVDHSEYNKYEIPLYTHTSGTHAQAHTTRL